ncbi:ABC transporter ATP-binding protein [Neotabrizicola shimadae]|uniref:ABC transporter ATP-binding protein n=1 Tax=Neotabrizicola shimadae TaxID=2807096 RepID=A0A8G0ZV68_9RHOB|nr:ABC transporter ATP-binding protein [Neotabrizicola shimadae]QYZ69278.1 ABC transporter ATP-binding protein [Neotabrizicola shimadae]
MAEEKTEQTLLTAAVRVLKENFPAQRKQYIIALVAMVVVAAMASASAWIMKAIFDVLSNVPTAYPAPVVAGMVLGIFILKGAAGYTQSVYLSRAGNRVVARIQRDIYRKLLQQEAAWFDRTESSDILIRVTQSAQSARMMLDTIVTGFVRDALTLIGLVAVMVTQQALLSIVFLVIGPLALLGVRALLARVRKIMTAELASLTEILKVIQETSAGLRVVRAFGLEPILERRMDKAVRDVEKRSNSIVRLESVTAPMMDILAGGAIATIVLISGVSAGFGGTTTAGELMAFITALLMAYEPAKRLSRMRVSLESAFVGVQMMFEILDRPDSMADPADAVALPHGQGEVALRNVGFTYDGKRPILSDLTLVFAPGRTTALVGPSGGGKSTIMSLLLRLYDPTEGHVEIDGTDLRRITRRSLQQMTAFVGQNTFLFSSTVRENIRMGRLDASDADVERAARSAQAHDFIMALPSGYDTPVGENGIFLSGGQRQRLSLARAILKDAPILLLDEATSALDNDSEALVRDAIAEATRGRTTIIIAHRLSTVMGADDIAFIEGGRLIEQGPLRELLERPGKFAALFNKEVSGKAPAGAEAEAVVEEALF